MKFKRFFASLFILMAVMGIGVSAVPKIVYAQIDAGLNEISQTTKLSSTDPRVIAARIINVAMGLLGIIMVCLILYGGFLWMTSGGDSKKTDSAKRVIRNAVIGLVIILSSWAIATFVISRLLSATGDGSGGGGGSGSSGGGNLGSGGGSSNVFQLRSITPAGTLKLRNVEVRFLFSRDVNPATAKAGIRVLKASDRSAVAGTVIVSGALATFKPASTCPAPNQDRNCFDAETEFVAEVQNTLRSAGGQTISCGGFSPRCDGRFKTGSIVDAAPPTVQISSPFDGQNVSADDLIGVVTRATDDSGVAYIEALINGVSIGKDGPASNTTVLVFDGKVTWDTVGLAPGSYTLQSKAHDIDSNSAMSSSISVRIRPAHCFNGKQDKDEIGLDCGGSCGACGGGACKVNGDCQGGVCLDGKCVEQPIITGISPESGREGTFVTITGVNFGSGGTVVFADGKMAVAPKACSNLGMSTWTEKQVIVEVPAGAKDGPVILTNANSRLSDATNDTRGPKLNNFVVSDLARPGICGIRPSNGEAGAKIDVVGGGFGSKADRLTFGDRAINAFLSWNDSTVGLNVPVLSPATYPVKIFVSSSESNAAAFRIDEKVITGVPTIDRMDPESGPIGEYITLLGRNFGIQTGTVIFKDALSGESGPADVVFPQACSKNFWHDTSIIVKVPKNIGALGNVPLKAGSYQVNVVRQDRVVSNPLSFTVNNNSPKPGLCSITPAGGPTDTLVTLEGERLGTEPGKVRFLTSGKNTVDAVIDPAKWKATSIQVSVPRTAVTGPVQIAQGQMASNSVNYEVRNCNQDPNICGKETCCQTGVCSVGGVCPAPPVGGEYAWRTSTGIIPIEPRVVEACEESLPPSPSPWNGRNGGDRACLNADLVVRFNTKLDSKTVTDKSFLVRICTGNQNNPCSQATMIAPRGGYPIVESADDSADYILFRPNLPNNLWKASSTYEIILTTAIKSEHGIAMKERADICGKGNGYCFRFSTQAENQTCAVGLVSVAPNSYTARAIGQTIPYRASPRAAGDVCIQLDGSSMNWTWDTANDGRATISNDKNIKPPGNILDRQTATALAETGNDSVRVNATVNQGAGQPSPKGTGLLSINFVPPEVEEHGPSCDQACVNAAVWARFNVDMDAATIKTDNIILKKCTNESCRAFDPPGGFSLKSSPIFLTVAPGADAKSAKNYLKLDPVDAKGVSLLEPGRFYKVVIRGGANGVFSSTKLPLNRLNDPDGFAWTFRTKEGENARCSVSKVEVTPLEKYATLVGERQSFLAQGIGSPDACNAKGQPLISDRTYDWTSANPKVARFLNGQGPGLIDTTRELPAHCSDRCINTGADGLAGKVASCGNSVIETTDTRYCQNGKTPFGDVCTLLSAGSHGAEECDLGGNKNGPNSTCAAQCLWNLAKPVTGGGTCGNGKTDIGEQCDPGLHCKGGVTPDAVCKVDADCGQGGICAVLERNGCSEQCQALGAEAGGSTCGNNDVADGETCDDGNTQSGDGCNTSCLHEGSVLVAAICGNGVVEPGESCEKAQNGAWPVVGCSVNTCLNIGTLPCNDPKKDVLCCGNAKKEAGEDCDDGNKTAADGCSARCLVEGSSIVYGKPSICGDGSVGIGEQCEAVKPGDALIDPVQLAEIVGTEAPDKDGRMSSKLQAVYDTKAGQAMYGLQCGFKEEAACSQKAGFGLTDAGCCSARPTLVKSYPLDQETEVCRNVLVSATFPMVMDEQSIKENFLLAKQINDVKCPQGMTPLSYIPSSGWWGKVKTVWSRLAQVFTGRSAQAAIWCVGSIKGSITIEPDGNGSKVSFAMEAPLDATSTYQVVFRGDPNINEGKRRGIKTETGVAADGNLVWSFTTGKDVCKVNNVFIRDKHPSHPALFITANEKHEFEAIATSLRNGKTVPLAAIQNYYDWTWEKWTSSEKTIIETADKQNASTVSTADVSSKDKNGSSLVSAGVVIKTDKVNQPSTVKEIIRSSKLATVLLCERPWPSRELAPFADMENSPSLAASSTLFAKGPFYNFSTTYCMDQGKVGPEDDLPSLNLQPVPLTDADRTRGILRQYLFTFSQAELKNDGLGIRIISNPLHLSPMAWYASQGFKGSPQPTTVDGYDAIREGNTIYVASVNASDPMSGDVTSTIYLISYNPNARKETEDIYKQLVGNWTFNVNFKQGAENICTYYGDKVQKDGAQYTTKEGKLVSCSADWECANYGDVLRCSSVKEKLQRDTRRIADFQNMSNQLEEAEKKSGKYPILNTGSFLQTMTTSRWPSWSAVLGSGLSGSAPAQDPVNKFLTCGQCSKSKTICSADSECPNGETCAAKDGYDPTTCWNQTTRKYHCPSIGVAAPITSHVYQYRAVDGGARYELSMELEGPSSNRYQPPLNQEVTRCSNTGQLCDPKKKDTDKKDADCVFKNNAGQIITEGTCNGTGGSWRYEGICDGKDYGIDDVCGNGVIGPNELCEIGDVKQLACSINGAAGSKLQVCSDCKKFVDNQNSQCIADSMCGNGRIDKYRCYGDGFKNGQACNNPGSVDECKDLRDKQNVVIKCESVVAHGGTEETCDEGVLNGTYGHCNRTCTGIGAYCGDGQLSLSESCDNGVNDNGVYCDSQLGCSVANSCSIDCRGVAPYCGDKTTNGGYEDCDGNIQKTAGAICIGGDNKEQPCNVNADCPSGVCGGNDVYHQSCAGITKGVCAGGFDNNGVSLNGKLCPNGNVDCGKGGSCVQYPTAHVRACVDPGFANQCKWNKDNMGNQWGACEPQNKCGDGALDLNEECDAGVNNNDNSACTSQCKKNICGDGKIQAGVEECDAGNKNGAACNDADYGSTCSGCSNTCKFIVSSGGYCGDKVKNGPEQCDAKQGLGTCSNSDPKNPTYCDPANGDQDCSNGGKCNGLNCKALGYDYQAEPISCTIKCGFTGCKRCQDEKGQGIVSGQVFDAVYSNQPVPTARVTLYYKGIKVDQVFTDEAGRYQFKQINQRPECGNYTITVDSYQDNPCTGTDKTRPKPEQGKMVCNNQGGTPIDVNEGLNGGYWAYESKPFNTDNFVEKGFNKIFLIPKVGQDETLVVFTWTGDLSQRLIDMRLLQPSSQGFDWCVDGQISGITKKNCSQIPGVCSQTEGDDCGKLSPKCSVPKDHYRRVFCKDWNDATSCVRTVTKADCSGRAVYNIDTLPYASLHCYQSDGKESKDCNAPTMSVQTVRYRRGPWAVNGSYQLFLVDSWGGGQAIPDYYNKTIQAVVRVVTRDRLYSMEAPSSSPACNQNPGKYWLVFQQDAGTGAVTITNRLMCTGDEIPKEGVQLPALVGG